MNISTQKLALLKSVTLLAAILVGPSSFGQGLLTPPGPPGPTMFTLDQLSTKLDLIDTKVEKRTPISALPFTISASGSYYLTGNLSGATGIVIIASNVTLDLNGFSLIGASATASAITSASALTNVTVRDGGFAGWTGSSVVNLGNVTQVRLEKLAINGTIAGTSVGFLTGAGAVVQEVRVTAQPGTGISVGTNSTVRDCVVTGGTGGGTHGFIVGANGTLLNCVAAGNGADGFNLGASCVVLNCSANGNGANGFDATGNGISLDGCSATSNTKAGFSLGHASVLKRCIAVGNSGTGIASNAGTGFNLGQNSSLSECAAYNNTGNGIESDSGSVVTRCTSRGNTLSGFVVYAGTIVSGCMAYSNQGDGILVNANCEILQNSCTANTLNGIHATSSGNRIDENNVVGNGTTGSGVGISLDSNSGNIVTRNTAKGNGTGGAVNFVNVPAATITAITGNAPSNTVTAPWTNFTF